MTSKPVTLQSAIELLVLLRTKKISALELADEHIRQIERLNRKINALVDFDPERVREQARVIDGASGRSEPLVGLPVTVKSSIHTVPFWSPRWNWIMLEAARPFAWNLYS